MEPTALLLTTASVAAAGYYAQQAHALRKILRQYAGRRIATLAPGHPDSTDGHRTRFSIIFLDLQGFTTAAEGLPPERVAWLLQTIFPPILNMIRDHAGEIDKLQGDAILCRHRSATQALEIAMEARKIAESLKGTAEAACGLSVPDLRAGVHTGDVWIGHLGQSGGFLDYTTIGDSVNTANRVQSLAGQYGYPVLCTGETYRAAADPEGWELLDVCRVRGRAEPLELYAMPPEAPEAWAMFCTARDLYADGDFAGAAHVFSMCRAPGARMWEARCKKLENNPSDLWEGIWTFKNKEHLS